MKIKLLKDKEEAGQIKTTIKRNRGRGVFWLKGTVLEVSDATGEKLVAAKEAEQVSDETPISEGQQGDFGSGSSLSNATPQTAAQE